jgi:DNA-binding response OmpR family regulator
MTPTDSPTILVVDDEQSVADIYARWLEPEYDVRVAYGGHQALRKFDDQVSVVLLDRRMPDLSGDDLLDSIRSEGLTCRVAMITAVEPDVDVIDLGFDDYLVKPISRDELVDVVERLLTRTTYEKSVQEYFALASKLALLEGEVDRDALQSSQEYADLRMAVREARREADLTLSEFTREDFEAVLHHPPFDRGDEELSSASPSDH